MVQPQHLPGVPNNLGRLSFTLKYLASVPVLAIASLSEVWKISAYIEKENGGPDPVKLARNSISEGLASQWRGLVEGK